jgi:hypothetical protein
MAKLRAYVSYDRRLGRACLLAWPALISPMCCQRAHVGADEPFAQGSMPRALGRATAPLRRLRAGVGIGAEVNRCVAARIGSSHTEQVRLAVRQFYKYWQQRFVTW